MTASIADQEIWHVLVASDDMKRMNVDQLDDAFRLDVVDASTLVWKTGMATWRRLGSLAGIEDEDNDTETITKQMMPADILRLMPPPPPPVRPAPSMLPKAPPKPPRPLHAQPAAPVFKTQQFAAPLVATPMYVPTLQAPDPYVLPKRRVTVPSEVDFRRKSGGVRLGRWLAGLLIITASVLVCYRQNLLREGARRVGVENKYLYGEKRAVGWVTAKAPPQVKNVLTRLALLPGPNAVVATIAKPEVHAAPAPQPVAAAIEPVKAAAPADDVKTVSLDSLPVEAAAATAAAETVPAVAHAAPTPKASAPRAAVASKAVVAKAEKPKRQASEDDAPAPAPKKKAEPKPEAEPKRAAVKAEAPPPGNESFLKAAIRSAIAADKNK